ncbi:MAG: peptidylprolyl isomerase [Pseudomonadota bacterium]
MAETPCLQNGTESLSVEIETALGSVTFDLLDKAAPNSTNTVRNLICFGQPDRPANGKVVDSGFYTGQTFDYTRPNFEVRVSAAADSDLTIDKELDAVALGLDEQTIDSAGAAMDTFQFELQKAFARDKRPGANTDQLVEWVDTFRRTGNAEFLIGKSRTEINQALGFEYQKGLASEPVARGSVLLQPASKTKSSPRLVFTLSENPNYTGRWVVVGRVSNGLDLLNRLSRAPSSGRMHPRWQPEEPVVITGVSIRSRKAQERSP